MKKYQKRLLSIAIAYGVVIVLVAVLFSQSFSTGAGDLQGNPLSGFGGMSGFGRARDKADGYDPAVYNSQGLQTTLPEGMTLAFRDGDVALYYHPEMFSIAVRNEKSGQVWLSNPSDVEGETLVGGATRDTLLSQLSVQYYNSGGQAVTLDSYNDSVKQGGASAKVSGNQLVVSYHISRTKITVDDIPQQLSDVRFEEILAKLEPADQEELKTYYRLQTLKGITSEKTKQILLDKYKNLEANDVYAIEVTTERVLLKVKALMDKAGYTTEDLIADNLENGIEAQVEAKAYFDMDLVYTLKNGRLSVQLDTASMQYVPTLPPTQIRVLEFFGAAGTQEVGYMLVPDGSGGLIHFNNGRVNAAPYNVSVYGKNPSMADTSRYQVAEQVLLPVFGLKNGSAAFVCSIKEGAELGRIGARVAGMTYSYNCVFASFDATLSQSMTLTSGEDTLVVMTEKNPYKGPLRLEYTFLEGENADYNGMAAAVRSDLLASGALPEGNAASALPLDVTFLGAVPVKTVIAGISVDVQTSMTSFSQAAGLVEELSKLGASPTSVGYIGWFNGGVAQKTVLDVRPESCLGGTKGLNALMESLSAKGIGFYPQTYFSTVFKTGDGYNKRSHAPRRLNGDVAVGYHYDFMNRYRKSGTINLVSPNHLVSFAETFLDKSASLQLPGLTSADLGTSLGADFSNSHSVDRVKAAELTVQALDVLAGKTQLRLSAPHLYAWKYASSISDLPLDDSWFAIVNESVPFVPMVLSGSISYSSRPLNMEADYRVALLEAVEYGAGLQYLLMAEEPGLLKETDYNLYYTGKADDWLPIAAADYSRAAAELASVSGKRIAAHQRLDVQLYRTTYENGVEVYVNYADTDAVYEGKTIGAKDYLVAG